MHGLPLHVPLIIIEVVLLKILEEINSIRFYSIATIIAVVFRHDVVRKYNTTHFYVKEKFQLILLNKVENNFILYN